MAERDDTTVAGTQERPSDVLGGLAQMALQRRDVTFEDIFDHLGSSSFGIVFILLALPALLPGPSGLVFGLAVALVAAQMIAGYQRPQLPGRLMRRKLPSASLAYWLNRSIPWLRSIERLHAPGRFGALTGPVSTRGMGALILLLGLAITLPIPLGNMLPVIAIVMIALALLARDGVALLVAVIAAKLALGWTVGIVWLGVDVIATLVTS
ncbi:MAG: exopolysaccharide biosynthesis protein [Rhizobiales bacterium PAR1]|nr:MAG: exopolysaccharide biosynthesis protein [Rhizobiales bacterium PAR1]